MKSVRETKRIKPDVHTIFFCSQEELHVTSDQEKRENHSETLLLKGNALYVQYY